MVPDEIPFGAWLRKQHLRLDLSRQALAGQAGCSEVTLRRIEAGSLKPSKQLALLLLEILGIPQVEREQWVRFARGQAGLPTQAHDAPVNQPKTNLPALLTSFIGREKERADVLRLLASQRLVTLTGSGGAFGTWRFFGTLKQSRLPPETWNASSSSPSYFRISLWSGNIISQLVCDKVFNIWKSFYWT